MTNLSVVFFKALLAKAAWWEYHHLLAEDLFANTTHKMLYEIVAKQHALSNDGLTCEGLRVAILAAHADTQPGKDLMHVVDDIDNLEETDAHVLDDSIRQFVERERLLQAANAIHSGYGVGQLDSTVVMGLLESAVAARRTEVEGFIDFESAPLPDAIADRPDTCGLRLCAELDDYLGGGVAAGELCIFLAPPSRGKTSYLCTVGARNMLAGRKVLHLTLEIAGTRVTNRYDSALCKMTRWELAKHKALVQDRRDAAKKAGGKLVILDWSFKGDASPAELGVAIERIRRSGVPPNWTPIDIDFVIVDYLELMLPNRSRGLSRRDQRHVFGQVGKDLRALAVDMQVPMVTAWQVNRGGSAEYQIQLDHISESWDIVKHADIMLSLNQTSHEASTDLMRIQILKQRDGTDRREVDLHSDLSCCDIREMVPVVKQQVV